ncbi:transcription factor 7-like 2 [Pseudoliparis swirei]|uniref:transcription factor 7-like 2 n=1 Tax=Pseudoliparis swirei TaxID=2059687 RepID=UPI0024BE993B|nr:transcription factor 7-like 2 [Pseudoliparis swirei]
MIGDLSPPTSPPPPSPPSHPGSVQSVDLEPLTVVQSGPLYNQAALGSQGQHNSYLTAQQIQTLPFWGYLPDGQTVHMLHAPTASLTAPTSMTTKKRKRVELHDAGPYVKKPPNAFMLFMREQRPNYAGQMKTSGSAGINRILGQKWKSLSNEEQAKYYKQADGEKRLHAQRHPGWTSCNNYGVKRKRDRSTAGKLSAKLAKVCTAASASGEK